MLAYDWLDQAYCGCLAPSQVRELHHCSTAYLPRDEVHIRILSHRVNPFLKITKVRLTIRNLYSTRPLFLSLSLPERANAMESLAILAGRLQIPASEDEGWLAATSMALSIFNRGLKALSACLDFPELYMNSKQLRRSATLRPFLHELFLNPSKTLGQPEFLFTARFDHCWFVHSGPRHDAFPSTAHQ